MRHSRVPIAVLTPLALAATLGSTPVASTTSSDAEKSADTEKSNLDEPDVVVARQTDERGTFFPSLELLDDGTLMAAYYDAPEHVADDGRISMVRSADQGQTWSDPTVIMDTPIDDRDPSLRQLSDGTLLLSFFSADRVNDPPEGDGVYVARSTDAGDTWSEPRMVGTQMRPDEPGGDGWAATQDRILELDNGDLLIPLYGVTPDDPSNQRSRVVRSTDQGVTWPAESETEIAGDASIHWQEPALVQGRDGTLTAMIRTDLADGRAYAATSTDDGHTWSEPEPTDMYAHASDLVELNNGMILHTWGDVSGEFGPGRPVVGRVKLPDEPWEHNPQVPLYTGSGGDMSYPVSVELEPGRFFTVYYDAPRGIIGGTFTKLSDYLSGPR